LKREKCPTVTLNGNQIPQEKTTKYLKSIYLDRRLTWRTHTFAKRKKSGAEIPKNVLDSRKKIVAINIK
jgi:hypothetical protein